MSHTCETHGGRSALAHLFGGYGSSDDWSWFSDGGSLLLLLLQGGNVVRNKYFKREDLN